MLVDTAVGKIFDHAFGVYWSTLMVIRRSVQGSSIDAMRQELARTAKKSESGFSFLLHISLAYGRWNQR